MKHSLRTLWRKKTEQEEKKSIKELVSEGRLRFDGQQVMESKINRWTEREKEEEESDL